jgi:hypothetical protein
MITSTQEFDRSGNESHVIRMPVKFLENLPRINRNWSLPPHGLACPTEGAANSANLNLP